MEGTPFGRYQLIELLGRGGMGEVWRAHDTEIDRTVAVKMLLPHFAKDPEFEKRFRREARAAARLDDPHVVPIHDVGEIDGRLYVTMRLINGVDLQTMLNSGPLDAHRAVHIVEQIASALSSAHQAGLVHRDVKPSNILVTPNDFAYLIDFGIARAAGDTALTSANTTIGTWAYMAPERFNTGQSDASSDIYALACVLYQCLTGELPFPGETLEQVAVSHMVMPPPPPSKDRTTIPSRWTALSRPGWPKNPLPVTPQPWRWPLPHGTPSPTRLVRSHRTAGRARPAADPTVAIQPRVACRACAVRGTALIGIARRQAASPRRDRRSGGCRVADRRRCRRGHDAHPGRRSGRHHAAQYRHCATRHG